MAANSHLLRSSAFDERLLNIIALLPLNYCVHCTQDDLKSTLFMEKSSMATSPRTPLHGLFIHTLLNVHSTGQRGNQAVIPGHA
ncbi:hypothetical protein ASF84_14035 [Pseudomonas sp. Leaf127]|nr:hypothetical protein ASF84_14035 [Pseudomonas sp. Leaf127]